MNIQDDQQQIESSSHRMINQLWQALPFLLLCTRSQEKKRGEGRENAVYISKLVSRASA